jgi:signal transduction histidine kinase
MAARPSRTAGGLLLGGLVLIWGAAIVSLAEGPGGWAHAALYIAVVVLVPVLVPWVVQGLTALQRSRLRATLGTEIPAPVRTKERAPWPAGPWFAAVTWRQLGYHLLATVTGVGGGLLVAACWLVAFPVAPLMARRVARADERLARSMLGPGRREELAQRIESLARSRADAVAAADTERRRIERDLHDGAQQRLVSLAMKLGMARERFAGEPEPVRQAIAEAHDEAVLALSELREFIRGLHPAVLADRGSTRPCPAWPRAPRCRSGCAWTCPGPPRRPWRPWPTSSSPRRSPTWSSTPRRPGPR